jgi:hypothetical protein
MSLGRRSQLSNPEGHSASGLLKEAYGRLEHKNRGGNAEALSPLELLGLARTVSVFQFISNLGTDSGLWQVAVFSSSSLLAS